VAGDADLVLTHEKNNVGIKDQDSKMTAGELLPVSDDGRQAGGKGCERQALPEREEKEENI